MKLYSMFAEWWPLLSAPEEYGEDAAAYTDILRRLCSFAPETLLELGSGGGNNASFMKASFKMTLTDLSADMLAVSRRLNPECEHILGDMRSLRLKRRFDCVFIHDAICYMKTRRDLERAVKTAFVHCRKGGAALFVPDYTRETFRSSVYCGGHDGENRSMRYLQWDHHPEDSAYRVDFAYMFSDQSLQSRDGGESGVRVEHETHVCGLFGIDEWYEVICNTGFEPGSLSLESEDIESGRYLVFTGRR